MKKILAFASVILLSSVSVYAQQRAPLVTVQDKTQPSPRLNPVQQHARELSYQMTHDLRLNGYQKARLQAINNDKQAKIVAILQKNNGNDKLVKDQCDAVCKERDKELQSVLSTDQYSSYYSSRREYNEFSMNYNAQTTNDAFVKSVKDPSPVSSKGATIGPARTTTVTK